MKTFPALIRKTTIAWGDRNAIRDRGNIRTYKEFSERGNRLANSLQELGIEPGDKVGLWLPNCAAYLEMFLACSQIGAVVVALNTKFKSHEMEDIVSRSGCKMLVLWPDFKNIPFLDILGGVSKEGLSKLEFVVCYGETDGNAAAVLPDCLESKKILQFDALLQGAPEFSPSVSPDDGLLIFTTSGTTGKPKFVLHTQYSVACHAVQISDHFGYPARECRLLQVNPLCGTFGLTQALSGFAGGGTVYCLPVFEAAEAAKIMQNDRITDINGSDDMFQMLLDQVSEADPFPALQNAGYAAFNPALINLVADAKDRNVKLYGLWGMSEVQAFVAHQRPEDPTAARKLAGGWLTSPNAKIRITDPNTNQELPFGEKGELEICCPSQMKEYWGNPEATAKAITPDGYIKTGDFAIQLDERRFTFLSRMGDVLRLGGFLTDPVEIENCLTDHPEIEKAQVVGVETDTGTKAISFLVLRPGAELDVSTLTQYCKSRMAGYKVPALFKVLDAFPTTQSANGEKVQRSKLRDDAIALWREQAEL